MRIAKKIEEHFFSIVFFQRIKEKSWDFWQISFFFFSSFFHIRDLQLHLRCHFFGNFFFAFVIHKAFFSGTITLFFLHCYYDLKGKLARYQICLFWQTLNWSMAHKFTFFQIKNHLQCSPLNRITSGQHKSDNNNRIIQITNIFCVLLCTVL